MTFPEMVAQPENMSKSLFPHQLSAIYMMEQREIMRRIDRHNFSIDCNVGVYAEISGYGKTLSIIALIMRDKMEWSLDEEYIHTTISSVYGHGSIIKKTLMRFKKIKTTLIVASTSILRQWCAEIETTRMNYTILTQRKKADVFDPCDYDIVLCSPTLYNYVLDRFPNYAWKRFIFDEPTQTKIPAMRQVITGFLWFITATPNQLLFQNRSTQNFLSSLFSNCMDYNLFKYLIVKNSDDFVKGSFALPSIVHINHECYQPVYRIVKDLISDNITEMIAAGNIEKAIRALGGNSTDSILRLIESEKMDMIREAEFKMERAERQQDPLRTEKWRERRRVLIHQLDELKRRFHDFIEVENCHICTEPNHEPVLLSCCQNIFCGKCVLRWLENTSTCPICRKLIIPEMMNYIQKTSTPSPHPIPPKRKTKGAQIVEIIQSDKDGKFIIFSSFDETLQMIRTVLTEEGIGFNEISGTMEARARKIDDFKNGDIDVLFMNSICNGAGINLQEASDIILYHKMSEDLESQIIGRAHRIGRTRELRVHHLV